MDSKDVTFDVPRFLSFIDMAYLHEAIVAVDQHFQTRIDSTDDRNEVGNLNATRQSLLRAAFVSAFAMLEQHLDEICLMERERLGARLKPNDLKDRGVSRSIAYATMILDYSIDKGASPWKELFELQEIRNHLVHYGPGFSDTPEHRKKEERFGAMRHLCLRPTICFTFQQFAEAKNILMSCVDSFRKGSRAGSADSVEPGGDED